MHELYSSVKLWIQSTLSKTDTCGAGPDCPSNDVFTRRVGLSQPYLGARVTLARWLSSPPCKRSARGNSPTWDSFPPSCVTSNLVNLNGITQYLIPELYYKHLNNIRYFLYTLIIFSHFFVNLTCFP